MNLDWQLLIIFALLSAVLLSLIVIILIKISSLDKQFLLANERLKHVETQREGIETLLKSQQQEQQQQRQNFDAHQIKSLTTIQDSLQKAATEIRTQVTNTLSQHSENLTQRVDHLTQETQQRLKSISEQVNQQLSSGFEKTTMTFEDVMKRLTIIDQAQKRITELSSSVVSLQELLSDKKSRGAFGEVQLSALIRNMIPESHFSLQHTLPNGKRPDCMLFLPLPTGNIAIDAKFPLESFRQLMNTTLTEQQRLQLEQNFRKDIRHHIQSIAEKYIIPNETADGAVMFIPAEAIFAEIHAHYPDLIEQAHKARVWIVSPTTMMAILTTARAVLKDEATRNQVHIIQEHLSALGKDFERFQKRMDNLAKHIDQAHQDVEQVHRSSIKISKRFQKIETVEISNESAIPNAVDNKIG